MSKDASGLRSIAARRSGMHCAYCRVPTAAEIEHATPRSKGGDSWMTNLVLSCPLCNKRKGTRYADDFIQSGDWRLPPPPFPDTLAEMLQECFGWSQGEGQVLTGSTNAFLLVDRRSVEIYIRPGRGYAWKQILVGEPDSPRTIAASWDFLTRHLAPKKPRARRFQAQK